MCDLELIFASQRKIADVLPQLVAMEDVGPHHLREHMRQIVALPLPYAVTKRVHEQFHALQFEVHVDGGRQFLRILRETLRRKHQLLNRGLSGGVLAHIRLGRAASHPMGSVHTAEQGLHLFDVRHQRCDVRANIPDSRDAIA